MVERLNVIHHRRLVGILDSLPDGRMAFEYAGAWLEDPSAFPVSVSLPLQRGKISEPAAHAFFANLLPEGEVRTAVARRLGLSAGNDFALLAAIGGECAGALAVLPEGAEPGEPEASYAPLPESAISSLSRRSGLLAGAAERRARLSLAGAQDKLPVAWDEARGLRLPIGGAPSTHILKGPSPRFTHMAANEVLMARLARRLGLAAIEARIIMAGGQAFTLVARFDRLFRDGEVVRLHQEDFCQALGRLPSAKYEEEGGPGFEEIVRVIRAHSATPLPDTFALFRWLAFNLLAGNADGHAKNVALLYPERSRVPRLAPFYDLVCTRTYPRLDRRLAMGIAGHRDPGRVGGNDWWRLAERLDVSPRFVQDEVARLATDLPPAFEEVAQGFEAPDSPAIRRIRKAITTQCRRSLTLLR